MGMVELLRPYELVNTLARFLALACNFAELFLTPKYHVNRNWSNGFLDLDDVGHGAW